MKRSHSMFLGLAVAAVAGLASAANAGTITYTSVTSPFTVGFGTTPTEINTNVTVPQWNSASFPGQTLVSVDVTMTVDLTGSIELKNGASTSQTVTATTSSQGTLSSFTPFTVSFSTGSQTLAAGADTVFSGLSGTNTFDSGLLAGGALAAYLGSGNVSFPYSTLTGLNLVGGGGQVSAIQTTNEDATLTVTYNYSGVPEPASLGLLGVGSSLLLLRRKRR